MAEVRGDEERLIEAWRPWLTLNRDMRLACMRLASGLTRVAVEATVSIGERWLEACRHQVEAALADAARSGEGEAPERDSGVPTSPAGRAGAGRGPQPARVATVAPRSARGGNGVRTPARAGNGAA